MRKETKAMKNVIKRITLTACAVLTAAMVAAAPALASSDAGFRSGPGSSTSAVSDTNTGNQAATSGSSQSAANNASASGSSQSVTNTATSSTNTVTTQAASSNTAANNNRYLTKWGGFFWFLLSVIVNFILSCWVANRFYRMAKKSAQSSNEVRALRKDIEERFASTIQDINEPAVEVINSNESYARDEEGIAMPEHKSHIELNDEEREMMRRWDTKRTAERTADDREEDDYDDAPRRGVRRAYQPTRRSSGIEFEDEEGGYEEDEAPARKARPSRKGSKATETLSSAKNKAKDFLSNVFPFED